MSTVGRSEKSRRRGPDAPTRCPRFFLPSPASPPTPDPASGPPPRGPFSEESPNTIRFNVANSPVTCSSNARKSRLWAVAFSNASLNPTLAATTSPSRASHHSARARQDAASPATGRSWATTLTSDSKHPHTTGFPEPAPACRDTTPQPTSQTHSRPSPPQHKINIRNPHTRSPNTYDYEAFTSGFTEILDPDIRAHVEKRLADGDQWPDPYLCSTTSATLRSPWPCIGTSGRCSGASRPRTTRGGSPSCGCSTWRTTRPCSTTASLWNG